MSKTIHLSVLSIFIAAALIGSVITLGDNMALATKKTVNEGVQVLEQSSGSTEFAECAAENNTISSCNNVALTLNGQTGNNAIGQQ